MQVTQSYARPSTAAMDDRGLRFDLPAEQSRPGVSLDAMVLDSLAYGRVMLALHAVVKGDLRPKARDHSAYQAWVQERYLEELPNELGRRRGNLPELTHRRDALVKQLREREDAARKLEDQAGGGSFWKAVQRYYNYLWKHSKDMWYMLDPVVSVHPDCVIFEVFSLDESSYGRVTVPKDRLEIFGDVSYGTTNIDFSQRLADEITRVRNYRPAFIQISAGEVTLATRSGQQVEKKIDLPPSWVRGFLQVQSAAAFSGTDLTLSASTVAEVLARLHDERENRGPRSLRFRLTPGERPEIVVDPWDTVIREPEHRFSGAQPAEIRIWGRRRLFVLESLLPEADQVRVRLLGTGMPTYWSVFQKDHRFDLGLSGWTQNDWSRAARFDLLAATAGVSPEQVTTAASALQEWLRLTPEELAKQSGLSRDTATAALQQLCSEGRAMFDPVNGFYRWRQLLAPGIAPAAAEEDSRVDYARRLVQSRAVRWVGKPEEKGERTAYRALVRGERTFKVNLELDVDGRVQYADCGCSWHRREKLRKGPCAHILAATALAGQGLPAPAAPAGGGAPDPSQLAGQTFVFTGALTQFTREEAEAMVAQRGGKATGSVSKNTSYLVAGDKAGSKLDRARELKVPVLTEDEFLALMG